jgi:hypothetical protein
MKKEVKSAKILNKKKHTEDEDMLTDVSHVETPARVEKAKGQLGDRMKAARELRGLTLADISSRTGIDMETLIERNGAAIRPVDPFGQSSGHENGLFHLARC